MRDVKRVEKCKWQDAKGIIEDIYKSNDILSPYQSFQIMNIIGLGRLDTAPFANAGYKECTFVLYDNNKPICCAPLYAKEEKEKVVFLLREAHASVGHLDFIYAKEYSAEDHEFFLNEIKKYYGKECQFVFSRISERSLIYQYESPKVEKMLPSKMVTVVLPDTYEMWYQSLSKSVRQNIRTAYNRMNTDNISFEYHFYTAQNRPSKKAKRDHLKLFCRRICEHSRKKRFLLQDVLYLLKKTNPLTVALEKYDGYMAADVYLVKNGKKELAAFFTGVISTSKKVLVPRLSMNMDYSRYSPGGVLINETMKQLCGQYSEFDLQRGDEPYKYSYGGTEYHNYDWKRTL